MRTMALDVGDKTIGVAVCDEAGLAPHGVTTIRRKGHKHDLPALERLAAEHEVGRIVVGLPLNMDGSEGPRALRTRRFADVVRERLALPVVLWDERLSTFEAQERMREAGVPPRRRKALVDQFAALVILESWLEAGAPVPT